MASGAVVNTSVDIGAYLRHTDAVAATLPHLYVDGFSVFKDEWREHLMWGDGTPSRFGCTFHVERLGKCHEGWDLYYCHVADEAERLAIIKQRMLESKPERVGPLYVWTRSKALKKQIGGLDRAVVRLYDPKTFPE